MVSILLDGIFHFNLTQHAFKKDFSINPKKSWAHNKFLSKWINKHSTSIVTNCLKTYFSCWDALSVCLISKAYEIVFHMIILRHQSNFSLVSMELKIKVRVIILDRKFICSKNVHRTLTNRRDGAKSGRVVEILHINS